MSKKDLSVDEIIAQVQSRREKERENDREKTGILTNRTPDVIILPIGRKEGTD